MTKKMQKSFIPSTCWTKKEAFEFIIDWSTALLHHLQRRFGSSVYFGPISVQLVVPNLKNGMALLDKPFEDNILFTFDLGSLVGFFAFLVVCNSQIFRLIFQQLF